MKKYCVIGWPLGHTLSPALHNHGFEQAGFDGRYEACPVRPEELEAFMDRFRRELSGASVTIPHKQAVRPYLDDITYRAKSVGAVNTLFLDGDKVCGDNTDVSGLAEPLRHMPDLPDSAMVLGAGGAARAAVVALKELEVATILIANRTRSKADILAHDFGLKAVDWETRHDHAPGIILNTTPLGMSGDLQDMSPWDAGKFPEKCVVYDIVYNPLKTRLLHEAEAAGCRIIQGLEMFLHQGLAQFRIWTGSDMDAQSARELLLKHLAPKDEVAGEVEDVLQGLERIMKERYGE